MATHNLAISLFDPQLDYFNENPTKSEIEKSHSPILALLGSSSMKMPIITHHLIIAEKRDERVAHRLEPILMKRIIDRIKKKVKIESDRAKLIAGISINIISINYDNVWDIKHCNNQIGKQIDEINDWDMMKVLILNLAGGTSAARTALYLATKRKLRTLKNKKEIRLGLLKTKCPKEVKASTAFEYLIDNNMHPVGLLAQGVGTRDVSFATELNRLEQVLLASRNEKVLITGPTGAGKSELAKLIMSYVQTLHDDITEKNCLHINVAAIPPSLVESELFGHEKGAFTGAETQHKGVFECANNGILFLDEIGELPKYLQAKLLTVLDGAPFTRVGGREYISTSFLLLCGTNVNLQAACKKGDFRQDLFERLRTWSVEVPPLHARFDDLEIALKRERGEWRHKMGKESVFKRESGAKEKGKGAKEIFLERAKSYSWPGNFREFHATFVHLAIFAGKDGITKADIEAEFQKKMDEADVAETMPQMTGNGIQNIPHEFDIAEIARLACALDVCRRSKTASGAGNVLFAARAKTAKDNGTLFNGAASLQRLFAQFGLKAIFRHGTFSVCPLSQQQE